MQISVELRTVEKTIALFIEVGAEYTAISQPGYKKTVWTSRPCKGCKVGAEYAAISQLELLCGQADHGRIAEVDAIERRIHHVELSRGE